MAPFYIKGQCKANVLLSPTRQVGEHIPELSLERLIDELFDTASLSLCQRSFLASYPHNGFIVILSISSYLRLL